MTELLDALEQVLDELAALPFDDPGQPSDGVKRVEQLARGYGPRECGGR